MHANQTMEATHTLNLKITPLEQIRLEEADVNRQIVAARQVAKQTIADAHRQAAKLYEEAVDAGYLAGQKAAHEHLDQIQGEVRNMIAQARVQAEESSQYVLEHMDAVVKYAVMFVIGLPEEGDEK